MSKFKGSDIVFGGIFYGVNLEAIRDILCWATGENGTNKIPEEMDYDEVMRLISQGGQITINGKVVKLKKPKKERK